MIWEFRGCRTAFLSSLVVGFFSKRFRTSWHRFTPSFFASRLMVHTHFYSALKNYVCIPIDFDPSLLQSIAIDDLPDNWQADPIPQSVKKAGDRWIKNQESVILKVPSAIIPVENNYLINPLHPDFEKIVIQYE